MNIGFTGTRNGMTEAQATAFTQFVCELPAITSFHHGDCVGADDDAADIMAEVRSNDEHGQWKIVVHPPKDQSLRACNAHADETREPYPYFVRNRHIVDACDSLIVCPKQMKWQASGGTWYTHYYAASKGKRIVVVWPDGKVTEGAAE